MSGKSRGIRLIPVVACGVAAVACTWWVLESVEGNLWRLMYRVKTKMGEEGPSWTDDVTLKADIAHFAGMSDYAIKRIEDWLTGGHLDAAEKRFVYLYSYESMRPETALGIAMLFLQQDHWLLVDAGRTAIEDNLWEYATPEQRRDIITYIGSAIGPSVAKPTVIDYDSILERFIQAKEAELE